ncbi:hypothetical protein KBI23_26000 [bacterium]|nr:hypothetical protein [bacterium]MBP9809016.1 hypothetical protein [bacterium]
MTPTTAQDFSQLLQRYLTEAKGHITKMAVFAFVLCLLPLVPLLAKIEFLWMLVFPIAAALFVRRGLQSVLLVKQRAVAVMQSQFPVKMSLTAVDKQFLFWNSESSPGYKLDLSPIDSGGPSIQKLKVDPASKAAVEKMAVLLTQFEQAKEANAAAPAIDAEVYFDEKQIPVAAVVNGELVWAANWW